MTSLSFELNSFQNHILFRIYYIPVWFVMEPTGQASQSKQQGGEPSLVDLTYPGWQAARHTPSGACGGE